MYFQGFIRRWFITVNKSRLYFFLKSEFELASTWFSSYAWPWPFFTQTPSTCTESTTTFIILHPLYLTRITCICTQLIAHTCITLYWVLKIQSFVIISKYLIMQLLLSFDSYLEEASKSGFFIKIIICCFSFYWKVIEYLHCFGHQHQHQVQWDDPKMLFDCLLQRT